MKVNRKESALCPDLKTGVVLFHGLTGMPSEMRPVAKYLAQMGCIVDCPILAGHGGGHKELLATGWKDWLADARRAVDALSDQCDHVVVGGLSMGALLAALSTIGNPKVSGLIMLSTTLNYDGTASNPLKHFLWLVDVIPWLGSWCWWTEKPPYGLKDERLQKIITKSVERAKRGDNTDFGLFRTYAGSLRQLHKLVGEIKRRAHEIKCPALVIHSLEDSMTTHKNAIEICTLLGSPDKSLVLLSGCDHVLTLDLRKKDVTEKMAAFISEQSWKTSKIEQLETDTAAMLA